MKTKKQPTKYYLYNQRRDGFYYKTPQGLSGGLCENLGRATQFTLKEAKAFMKNWGIDTLAAFNSISFVKVTPWKL